MFHSYCLFFFFFVYLSYSSFYAMNQVAVQTAKWFNSKPHKRRTFWMKIIIWTNLSQMTDLLVDNWICIQNHKHSFKFNGKFDDFECISFRKWVAWTAYKPLRCSRMSLSAIVREMESRKYEYKWKCSIVVWWNWISFEKKIGFHMAKIREIFHRADWPEFFSI